MVAITKEEAEAFGRVYILAQDALLAGKPGPMVETLLWIDDKESMRVVPFRLNENQRYMHREVFGGLKHWRNGVDIVILKDRQATMTSILQGIAFVFDVNLPNIGVVHVFQDKATGDQLMNRLDLFWGRLNPIVLEHDGLKVVKVGDSKSELKLEFWDRGVLLGTSYYLIVSAGAKEFGAGLAPNFIIYDEYDLYPNLDLVGRIEAAKGPNCKTFKLSTPRGMKQLYTDYFAAKEGKSGAQAIALYCFQNPSNRMAEGSRLAPPVFRWSFDLLPEHRQIMESPEWEERSAHKEDPWGFFRWYEWKRQGVRQRQEAEGIRDENRVLGEMHAEHAVNDRDCWLNFGKTPFSQEVLRDYAGWAAEAKPKLDDRAVFRLVVMESPQPGMVYACSVDCAEGGKAGDAISAHWKNARGEYVAWAYGRADLAVCVRKIVKVCNDYYGALLAPEIDGGLGLFVIEEAKRAGYTNFWAQPPKPGDDWIKAAMEEKKLGWRTQGNKADMLQRLISRFNNRDFRILDDGFLRDAANFDPETVKHTPDRLMDCAIMEAITDPDNPKGFGRQFAAMSARVRGLREPEGLRVKKSKSRGWPQQQARPFVMR